MLYTEALLFGAITTGIPFLLTATFALASVHVGVVLTDSVTTQSVVSKQNVDASKIDVIAESIGVYGPQLPDVEVHSRDGWKSFIQANRQRIPNIELTI